MHRKPVHSPRDPLYESKVRESFAKQTFMTTLGARIGDVLPGVVTLELDRRDNLSQQHGFIHAGVVASILDSACGYAALSLFPPKTTVLSTEFKVNLLAPAKANRLVARAEVIKSGRTLTICEAAVTDADNPDTIIAIMVATMIALPEQESLKE